MDSVSGEGESPEVSSRVIGSACGSDFGAATGLGGGGGVGKGGEGGCGLGAKLVSCSEIKSNKMLSL